MKRVLLEAILVGGIGLMLSLVANALSPLGLSLSRNYFPATVAPTTNEVPATSINAGGNIPDTQAPAVKVAARLQQKGLKLATGTRVYQLFQDPRREQGLVIFIDARDNTHYQQGHIPGAWQLDYYHYEAYLAAVLPVCMMSQEIVVYCNGGDCEDSEFTALLLRDAQIPLEKIMVYGGGMAEWQTNGWPIETGGRNSGWVTQPDMTTNTSAPSLK